MMVSEQAGGLSAFPNADVASGSHCQPQEDTCGLSGLGSGNGGRS